VKWIDPKFQRRYVFLLLAITFLVSAILFGIFWVHIEAILTVLIEAGFMQTGDLFAFIEDELISLLLSVMFVVIFFSLILVYFSVMISHRIAGPMFALKRSLDRIAEGNLKDARVKFRSKDEFHEIADALNRVVDELEKKA
ncbi:MAG: HAMP domain-containing protein, partial [Bdellovibrionota bacterium]